MDEAVEITMPLKGICNREKGEVTMATEEGGGPHLRLRYTISAKVIRAYKVRGGVEEMGGRGWMSERGGREERGR